MNGQMNGVIGPGQDAVLNQYGTGNNYAIFKKFNDINNPSPSLAFVFIDEHADSINDGLFRVDMTPTATLWKDLPASYHGASGVLAFADGHAEVRRWTDISHRQSAHHQDRIIPAMRSPIRSPTCAGCNPTPLL